MADKPSQLQSVIRFQEAYMEQEKMHKRKVRIVRSMLLVLFLALWELCARLGMIDDFIFSSPSRVLFCFWKMVRDGSIFAHIGITLFETVVSFAIVTASGICVAVLLWASRSASEILEPYLVMLNSLPKSALAPMLIVWMGSHVHTIIAAAVSVAVFGSILTLHTGFLSMDPDKIRLIYALGGSKKDVLTKVLLPGSVPLILSNMKVNVGLCLVGVIIGEFLAARRGLGYLIIYGSQVFQLDCVVLSIVLLCLFSALFYRLIAGREGAGENNFIEFAEGLSENAEIFWQSFLHVWSVICI